MRCSLWIPLGEKGNGRGGGHTSTSSPFQNSANYPGHPCWTWIPQGERMSKPPSQSQKLLPITPHGEICTCISWGILVVGFVVHFCCVCTRTCSIYICTQGALFPRMGTFLKKLPSWMYKLHPIRCTHFKCTICVLTTAYNCTTMPTAKMWDISFTLKGLPLPS